MDLLEALKTGTVAEYGMPERAITTVISQLFIYKEKVVKVYKKEPFFFADLSNAVSRKEFVFEDFFWNNTAAPEIYRHLWGVVEKGGSLTLVPATQGEDFIIEMSRIDDSKTLTKLLSNASLRPELTAQFVDALVDILGVLTKERSAQLKHLFDKGLYAIMQEDIKSLRSWLYDSSEHIPKQTTDEIIEVLLRAFEKEPYFTSIDTLQLSAAIDNNSDNMLLVDGRPSFIDIMPPMDIWRVVDEYATISRLFVDIEVLGNKKLGDVARAAYAKYQRDIPPVACLMHELRAACIQWPYRYMLKQDDVAKKFGEYAQKKMAELETALSS